MICRLEYKISFWYFSNETAGDAFDAAAAADENVEMRGDDSFLHTLLVMTATTGGMTLLISDDN